MSTTTKDHACTTHRAYWLTCDQYDEIRDQYGWLCWRCLEAQGAELDHDHRLGVAAVRGYVCGPCNRAMTLVDAAGSATTAEDAAYLKRAWHIDRGVAHREDRRTPVRKARVDDDLWDEVARIAAENRESVSAVLKRALVDYVRQHGGKVTKP